MRFQSLVLASALAAFAVPAAAGEQAPRTTVRYGDLDLTTEAGQVALERRISASARELCEAGMIRTGTILPSRHARDCAERAKASAYDQVATLVARAKRG